MKKVDKWCLGVVSALLLLIIAHNIANNCSFMDTSLTTVISIGIAILVAYYFVQMRTEERKQKEIIEKMIDEIRAFASDPSTTHWPDTYEEKETLTRIRRIRNKLSIIENYSELFEYQTEIAEIKKNFEKYEEAVDAHQNDVMHLKQCQEEFCKWMGNINNRCDELIYKLYPAPKKKGTNN